MEKLKEAYEIMRKAAKEVLLTVYMSDLDRKQGDCAVPVAYNLSGFSLPMKPVRAIRRDLATACKCSDRTHGIVYLGCWLGTVILYCARNSS